MESTSFRTVRVENVMSSRRLITSCARIALAMAATVDEATIAQDSPGRAESASEPASVYIQQLLTSEDIDVRRRAAYLLGRIDAPADVAVPALEKALSDGQMETRWYAIDALGRFGPAAAPATAAIIKSLESTLNDKTVRRRGARSLGRIGPAAREAVPVLEDALESDDALYRISAAQALWRINKHERALPELAKQLASEEPPVAFAAAVALGELTDASDKALAPLVAALAHADADVRQAAAQGLVNIGPDAIEPLSQIVSSSQPIGREDAARALGMIIDQLRQDKLYDDTATQREFAAAAVPLVRTAFPALAGALAGDSEPLRKASALALANGGSAAIVQLLGSLSSGDAVTRSAAAGALARLESRLPKQRPLPPNVQLVHQRIIDPLIAALASEDPLVQKAGVRLFVALELGEEAAAAEPHLRRALETGDLATRRHADKALKQLQSEM